MRTVTVAHNLFTFDELVEYGDSAALNRATSWVAEVGQPDPDMETEFLTMLLQEVMGDGAKVTEWSVGWCQSDDLALDCDIDDLASFVPGDGADDFPAFPVDDAALRGVASVSVRGGGISGYGSRTSVTIGWGDFDDSGMTYSQLAAQDEAAEQVVLEWYRDVARYLYDVARKDYEAWWDTDTCADYARDMGYEFLADGSRP